MKISSQDVYNILAVLAIVISAISLYLQLAVRGPLIELLNATDTQQRVPRPHGDLPKDIQEKFPNIPDAAPGYALVKLIFGNSGDRVGIANIQDIKAKIIKSGETEIIRVSSDKYILVPAYAIVETEILMSNIQISHNTIELELELAIEYGGYNPDNSKYTFKGATRKNILVNLVPGDERPWYTS